MVSISRGVTFYDSITAGITTGYTAAADLLQTMVTSALATSFSTGEFRNDGSDRDKAHVFHVSASQVGPSTQQSGGTTFYDTANDIVRVEQHGAYDGQFDYINVINDNSLSTLPLGTVVRQTGLTGKVPKVEFISSLGYPDSLGVVLADIAPDGVGLLRKYGFVEINVTGVVTAGDQLVSSATTGYSESIQGMSGYPTVTHGIAFAQCSKNVAAGNTTVTCHLYM